MSLLTCATDSTFEELIRNTTPPVLVTFFATWNSQWQRVHWALEDLAAEYGDALNVVLLDIDAYPQLADRYDIQAFPTFYLFHRDGQTTIADDANYLSRTMLAAEIEEVLRGDV